MKGVKLFVTRICNYTLCSKEYQAEQRYLNRGQGLYCSRSCSGLNKTVSQPSPNAQCAWCHTDFYVKPSRLKNSKSGLYFCSKDHQILGYQNNLIATGPEPTNFCSCGAKLVTSKKCLDCSRAEKKRLLIEQWLAGDSDIATQGTYGAKTFVKAYLIETRGDKCEECGFSQKHPVYGTSIIQMDHIDGNSQNNLIENLILLCPNHHAMTSTYGSKNKNSGRVHRRKS